MRSSATARAPVNIALVKYWGKREARLNLPVADSISVCLDRYPTTVTATTTPHEADSVWWSGQLLTGRVLERYARVLTAVRHQTGERGSVRLDIEPTLPPRVGLAGSAAAMAAVAGAVAALHEWPLDLAGLSALARLGSGSACRSVPDGFVRWHRGARNDGADSAARSLAGPDHWPDLRLRLVIFDDAPKATPSSEGMARTAASSPLFPAWQALCAVHAKTAQRAIAARDFASLAAVSQANARAMHATALAAQPPVLYWSPDSLRLMALCDEWTENWPLFYTFDAGPNAVLFTLAAHEAAVTAAVAASFPRARLLPAAVGPGLRVETP